MLEMLQKLLHFFRKEEIKKTTPENRVVFILIVVL